MTRYERQWQRYADAVAALGGSASSRQVAEYLGASYTTSNSWLIGAVNSGLLKRARISGAAYTYSTLDNPS